MNTRKLTITGLLMAVGVLLPQLFHFIGGPSAGRVFLPMHIGIFLIGFIVGGWHGIIAGITVPILSFLISGMPAPPTLFFMMFELAVYGAVSGFMRFGQDTKWMIYPKLVISMIAGRIASGLAMYVAVLIFNLEIAPVTAVLTSVVTGLPGIAIQIVLIPPICILLKRGGFFFEESRSKA